MADELIIKKELIEILTPNVAWNYQIIPQFIDDDVITFYAQNSDSSLIEELELLTGKRIKIKIEDKEKIHRGTYSLLSIRSNQ